MPAPETRQIAATEAARRARSVARVTRALAAGEWNPDAETLAGLAELAATAALWALVAERDAVMG